MTLPQLQSSCCKAPVTTKATNAEDVGNGEWTCDRCLNSCDADFPKADPKTITDLVMGHWRKIAESPWPVPAEKMSYVLPMLEMKAIVDALLIAVEALEEIAADQMAMDPDEEPSSIARAALAQL